MDSAYVQSVEQICSNRISASQQEFHYKLCCIDDSQKQQTIATVCILGGRNGSGDQFGRELESLFPNGMDLVIRSYCKDIDVLAGLRTTLEVEMKPVTEHDERKLKDFGLYLMNRKKTGVLTCCSSGPYAGRSVAHILPFGMEKKISSLDKLNPNSLVLAFVVPMSLSNSSRLQPVSSAKPVPATATSAPATATKPGQAKTADNSTNSKSATLSSASAASSSSSSSSSAAVAVPSVGSGLLASLFSMVDRSNQVRVAAATGTGGMAARVNIVDRMATLEKELHQKIDAFIEDDSIECLRLDPMNKDERYVVHDVVSQYSQLNSLGVGDYDERHVVIYRIDRPPEDLKMQILAKEMQKVPRPHNRTSKSSTASIAPLPPPPPDALIRVGQVKRDRRTIEEIEDDIRKRKQHLTGGVIDN